jgi:HAE1 family hydrophobic/amphiphilic exporter-1
LLLLLFTVSLDISEKIFCAQIALLTILVVWVIAPILYFTGKVITYIPIKITKAVLDGANAVYPKIIGWNLRNPFAVVLVVALCGWITWDMTTRLETELLPEVYQGEFTFEVRLPVGTPLEETQRILSEVEDAILVDKEQIRTVLVTYGYDVTNTQRSDEGEHTAKFKILLQEEVRRNPIQELILALSGTASKADVEQAITERLRQHFLTVPDLDVRVDRPVLFSATTPIEVEIHGDDLAELKEKALEVQEKLSAIPELADVESSLKAGAPEVQVVYDRNRIMTYGLNLNQVAVQVRDMVKGFEATRFNMKDRRVPILVRLDETNRERLEDVEQLTINPGGQFPIPLGSVANITIGEGPSEVRRIDGRRVALINANIAEGSLGSAVVAIERTLDTQVDWPEDLSYYITGQNREWERSEASLYLALFLSLFLVYVIMASQFESLIHPFIIMFTIPLAFFGTVLGLNLLNINLSIVVFLGMIMLAGIVVNNAIVLVDYINTLKRRGMETTEAIITGGKVRLRPILMTTATTMLGLLPMAFGLGDGAEIRTPMAVAVIFGLFTSTFLTLLVIPTVYYILDVAAQKIFHKPIVATVEAPTGEEAPA